MEQSDPFAGGDVAYLRDVQYRDSTKLAARARLHAAYGRGDWFPWWATQVPWPGNPTVLEVGCGAGWAWAEAMAQIPPGLHLTLTDLSQGMLDEALARVTATNHYESVVGRVADAQDLPYDDDSFDLVVSNHMLYHLPDPARGVAELARVLRPDGVAAVVTNGEAHLRELWALQEDVFPGSPGADNYLRVFGLETGEPMLRAAFGSVELTRYPDQLRCTDPGDVLAFITSTPPADTAGPDAIDALRVAVDDAFARGGGVFEISKDVGLFICRP
jgi:SAM-dependent methyltransferase